MLFADLTLEKIILEVRYNQSFLYWDNSGKAMASLVAKHPKIEIRDVQLSNTVSDWSEEGLTINFNNLKGDVTQDFPKSLETFKGVCATLCDALKEFLEVKAFSRIGLRIIHSLPTKTAAEARELMSKTNLVQVDASKLEPFGKGRVEERQTLIRYESEDKGCAFRISHASREVTVKIARPFIIDSSKFSKEALIVDVDFYTKKSVDVPVFVPADFIRLSYRTLEQNVIPFLGL